MRAVVLCLLLLSPVLAYAADPNEEEWIQLFNGRDLDGWIPKIRNYPAGENFGDTFRVRDGLLEVHYGAYDSFDERFGHLFYEQPFRYYRMAVEYRFVGQQATEGPGWARRNSGVMVHGQPPETMTVEQNFPISIEVQLLGGLGEGERTTANLCTPGTHVVMDGKLVTRHCTPSASKTYDGEQWVRVEILVLGDSLIRHVIDGETVLQYNLPQVGGEVVDGFDPAAKPDGALLSGGSISLQSESHPVQFRKVELLDLEGCLDPEALNYKSYFVKSVPERCRY